MNKYIIIIYALMVGVSIARQSPILNIKVNKTIKEIKLKKIDISTPKYPNTYTLVDDEDYKYLNKWKWYKSTRGYVVRNNYPNSIIKMHRIILNAKPGQYVDHKNNNRLDNRKTNIRLCNAQQNSMNQTPQKNKSSKYKGVSWSKVAKKWHCYIWKDNKRYHLGYYENESDAAIVYNKNCKKLHKNFANLNRINYA